MLETIFKQYDIRGKYPLQINEVIVFDIMRKFPMVFGEKRTIVVGYDVRHSSPSLYKAAIETLHSIEYTVIAAGMITTPMMVFLVKYYGADGGIMITASHNPKEQNGIKIVDKNLSVIGGKELYERIAHFFSEEADEPTQQRKSKGKKEIKKEEDARKAYAAFLASFFEKEKGTEGRKKIKIVIDCSNGSAGRIVRGIKFPSYVQPIILNDNPDGNFTAHAPNPLEEKAITQASKAVVKHGADMGVVMDGDGDRVVFLDGKGRRVRGGHIWKLLCWKEKFKKTIVTEPNVYLVRKIMKESPVSGVQAYLSKVGRKYLVESMKRHRADFGFENSGHFYFKDFFYSDCGIVTWIKAIQAVRALPYTLADFVDMLPSVVRLPEYNVPAPRVTSSLYRTWAEMIGEKAKKISFFDGVSMLFDRAFLSIRISNTEDIVRVIVEGDEEKEVRALQKKAIAAVREMTR